MAQAILTTKASVRDCIQSMTEFLIRDGLSWVERWLSADKLISEADSPLSRDDKASLRASLDDRADPDHLSLSRGLLRLDRLTMRSSQPLTGAKITKLKLESTGSKRKARSRQRRLSLFSLGAMRALVTLAVVACLVGCDVDWFGRDWKRLGGGYSLVLDGNTDNTCALVPPHQNGGRLVAESDGDSP